MTMRMTTWMMMRMLQVLACGLLPVAVSAQNTQHTGSVVQDGTQVLYQYIDQQTCQNLMAILPNQSYCQQAVMVFAFPVDQGSGAAAARVHAAPSGYVVGIEYTDAAGKAQSQMAYGGIQHGTAVVAFGGVDGIVLNRVLVYPVYGGGVSVEVGL